MLLITSIEGNKKNKDRYSIFIEAKARAVRYLSLRVRCEKDIKDKLGIDGYDNKTIQKVIEDLKSIGYINDRIYAQKYIYDRSKIKPISKKLMRYELKRKGIEEEIIDEALSGWEVDETALAESLARRKFGKYDLNNEKIKRKIYLFLNHRGFSFDVIEKIIKNM